MCHSIEDTHFSAVSRQQPQKQIKTNTFGGSKTMFQQAKTSKKQNKKTHPFLFSPVFLLPKTASPHLAPAVSGRPDTPPPGPWPRRCAAAGRRCAAACNLPRAERTPDARCPFGKMDGPGQENKTHLHRCLLVTSFNQTKLRRTPMTPTKHFGRRKMAKSAPPNTFYIFFRPWWERMKGAPKKAKKQNNKGSQETQNLSLHEASSEKLVL